MLQNVSYIDLKRDLLPNKFTSKKQQQLTTTNQ